MNEAHLEFCASPEWARLVEDELLPWVLDGCELGDDLLEVGPGPGLTTDVLRRKAARVTAIELDLDLAGKLASRLPFPADRFSAAACLTMLHHIPSPALQDAALAELAGLFPGPFLHIGGDEPYGMPDQAYGVYVRRLKQAARALGKRTVGWQESIRADADPGHVIQYWMDASSLGVGGKPRSRRA